MLLCCDDLAWMLGKIVKYKPRARVFNFDMQWKADTTQQHGVKLAAYHQQGRDAEAGSWLYLKKTVRPGALVRGRDDDDNNDSDGGGGPAPGGGDSRGNTRARVGTPPQSPGPRGSD